MFALSSIGRGDYSCRAHPRVDDWRYAGGGGRSLQIFEGALTARESEQAWHQFGGTGTFASSLIRLSAAVGSTLAATSSALLSAVRDREALPRLTASLLISLDDVMMRMNAETGGETETDAGWREAAGNLLDAGCFSQLPAAGKETLKAQLSAELFHWLKVNPDLKVVAVADGARDNGTYLESI